MRDFKGLEWHCLTVQEQKHLLKDCRVIDGSTCSKPTESMFCVVDLEYPYCVDAYYLVGDEENQIIIEQQAIIYCSED